MTTGVFLPFKRGKKIKSKARSRGTEETRTKSIQERNRRAHRQPCQHAPSALTSGEKAIRARANEHSVLHQDLALLCSHPALRPGTALPPRRALRRFKWDYCARASPPCVLPPPSILSQGRCEAITTYNAPCSQRAQESPECWSKATEQAEGSPTAYSQSKTRIRIT